MPHALQTANCLGFLCLSALEALHCLLLQGLQEFNAVEVALYRLNFLAEDCLFYFRGELRVARMVTGAERSHLVN